MLGTHVHNENEISHKVEKRGKPHRKNPPPKREMKDVWMDGVIKIPHYDIHQVYTKEKNEKKKRDKVVSPLIKSVD